MDKELEKYTSQRSSIACEIGFSKQSLEKYMLPELASIVLRYENPWIALYYNIDSQRIKEINEERKKFYKNKFNYKFKNIYEDYKDDKGIYKINYNVDTVSLFFSEKKDGNTAIITQKFISNTVSCITHYIDNFNIDYLYNNNLSKLTESLMYHEQKLRFFRTIILPRITFALEYLKI